MNTRTALPSGTSVFCGLLLRMNRVLSADGNAVDPAIADMLAVRAARLREALLEREGQSLQRGDILHTPDARYDDIQLVLCDADSCDPSSWLVVPADDHVDMVGSQDIEVPPNALGGPLVLRCGKALYLHERALAMATRVSVLDERHLGRVKAKRTEELPACDWEIDIDEDPEYRLWMDRLDQLHEFLRGFHAITPPCAACEDPNNTVSVDDLRHLLALVGSLCHKTAGAAAKRLLTLWHDYNSSIVRGLRELTRVPLCPEDKYAVLNRATEPRMRAFLVDPIPHDVARRWLTCETAPLYALSESQTMNLFVSRVDPEDRRFSAAWMQLGPRDHVFLISKTAWGSDVSIALYHELEHMLRHVASQTGGDSGSHKRIRTMDTSIDNTMIPFALAQKNVDPDDKKLVALWAAEEKPLSDGAGVFIDAGSSCLAVWEVIREQLSMAKFANILVSTSNFLILQDWATKPSDSNFPGTSMEMAGDIFDAPHMAFFGETAEKKLLSGSFRPAVVYIGTSGVEFEEDSLLLGYHAGDLEKDAKELLFKCPAKVRIILATPRKIGNAGGRVFNVLAIENIDARAPIYLVTTTPTGAEEEMQFSCAKSTFSGEAFETAVRDKGLEVHWIIVDRNSTEVPKAVEHLVIQKKESAGLPLHGDGVTGMTALQRKDNRRARTT